MLASSRIESLPQRGKVAAACRLTDEVSKSQSKYSPLSRDSSFRGEMIHGGLVYVKYNTVGATIGRPRAFNERPYNRGEYFDVR